VGIKIYQELEQGSDAWFSARCSILTASEMKHIITPKKLEYSVGEKEKTHLYELAAQRINQYVEPHYVGDDMLRGVEDEVEAKILYAKHCADITDVGFITNDRWGFKLGYSPDGLIGDHGCIECKSRRQKYQFQSILNDEMPEEFLIQVQTGMLVSERSWCDFITYSAGMPMMIKRIFPDKKVQDAIVGAAVIFHEKLDAMIEKYQNNLKSGMILIPTERKIHEEITV